MFELLMMNREFAKTKRKKLSTSRKAATKAYLLANARLALTAYYVLEYIEFRLASKIGKLTKCLIN